MAGAQSPDDIEDRDPGLAQERTELAWTRTAISFAALGAAMLRSSIMAGLLAIATATLVWALGQLSARRRRGGGGGGDGRDTVRLITATTLLVCLLAVLVALFAPPMNR